MLGLRVWFHMYVLGFRVCIEAAAEAPMQCRASPAAATATKAHMLGVGVWFHTYILGLRVCIKAAPGAPMQHTASPAAATATKAHSLRLTTVFMGVL